MLTGDAEAAARQVADSLGVDEMHSQLLPADKVQWVERLLAERKDGRLLAKADGTVITKDRWRIPCGPYTIELDVFAPPFAPLVMAEVEFPTAAEAMAFQPPAWFGEEVTYDPAYSNSNLSKQKFDG